MIEKKFITKEEINSLPLLRFDGEIKIVEKKEQALKVIEELSKEPVLGFDTETRPSFKKSDYFDVSLLSLSTEKCAYLFRINKMSLLDEIVNLLSDPKVLKVGVAVEGDICALKKLKSFQDSGFVELSDLAKKLEIKNFGLRSLSALLLKGRVSKGAKLSNWEADKLKKSQLSYAATDAWVGLKLYNLMISEV